MTLTLGVDTGGTYTDAVLLRDGREVVAAAKSLTTRDDLARGIGLAVSAVLRDASADPAEVGLASLSTTLATNALVEGNGGAAALVAIGFSGADLARQGLMQALGNEPLIAVAGGHDHAGAEAVPLDGEALSQALDALPEQTSAVAVASHFATRNPAHEQAARELIRARTGLPVSCSHELSSRLGGPKRALTALLNARLIGMIDRLIASARDRLSRLGVNAPLMVVRGDGALISAAVAREKPIETILSGPAASIVGACWLTGIRDALVSDIGGTTTDVALLRDGRPGIDPAGALVGGHRTMVRAVDMRTTGLGGDSEVHLRSASEDAGHGPIRLGPRRVMPLSLAASSWDNVLPELEAQAQSETRGEHDGRFVALTGAVAADSADPRERALLDRLRDAGCAPMGAVAQSRVDLAALRRLAVRGVVIPVGITPSDAAHVLGLHAPWNRRAAELGLELFARQRTTAGVALADGAVAMARLIADQLRAQTVQCLLTAAFAKDAPGFDAEDLARHWLTRAGLNGHRGVARIDLGLNLPVIGLGASAATWYPQVGERLGATMIVPEHAGVANAIGAVAGQVSICESGTVTVPAQGRFRVHLPDGPQDFPEEAAALRALEDALSARARAGALRSGAAEPELQVERDLRVSTVEGARVFISAEIRVTATGRPGIAGDGPRADSAA